MALGGVEIGNKIPIEQENPITMETNKVSFGSSVLAKGIRILAAAVLLMKFEIKTVR